MTTTVKVAPSAAGQAKIPLQALREHLEGIQLDSEEQALFDCIKRQADGTGCITLKKLACAGGGGGAMQQKMKKNMMGMMICCFLVLAILVGAMFGAAAWANDSVDVTAKNGGSGSGGGGFHPTNDDHHLVHHETGETIKTKSADITIHADGDDGHHDDGHDGVSLMKDTAGNYVGTARTCHAEDLKADMSWNLLQSLEYVVLTGATKDTHFHYKVAGFAQKPGRLEIYTQQGETLTVVMNKIFVTGHDGSVFPLSEMRKTIFAPNRRRGHQGSSGTAVSVTSQTDGTSTATTVTATTYATSDGATDGTCATDGSSHYYSETVDGNTRKISTNTCPNHPYAVLNPNTAYGVTTTYKVPAYPMYDGTETDLSEQGGGNGLLFNGAFIFSAYGGSQYGQTTTYTNTAAYAEGDTFDQCGCHASTSDSASYHCHVPPMCLLDQLGATDTSHSPQIGWAADGFPVYGPRGSGGTLLQTCTVKGGTYGTDACTDDCNGVGSANGGSDWIDDGYTYRYYYLGDYDDGTQCVAPTPYGTSSSDYYPMTPLCYKGCCPSDATCSMGNFNLPTCSSSATTGYTSIKAAQSAQSVNGEACAYDSIQS